VDHQYVQAIIKLHKQAKPKFKDCYVETLKAINQMRSQFGRETCRSVQPVPIHGRSRLASDTSEIDEARLFELDKASYDHTSECCAGLPDGDAVQVALGGAAIERVDIG
jgi:hypothetical protein